MFHILQCTFNPCLMILKVVQEGVERSLFFRFIIVDNLSCKQYCFHVSLYFVKPNIIEFIFKKICDMVILYSPNFSYIC